LEHIRFRNEIFAILHIAVASILLIYCRYKLVSLRKNRYKLGRNTFLVFRSINSGSGKYSKQKFETFTGSIFYVIHKYFIRWFAFEKIGNAVYIELIRIKVKSPNIFQCEDSIPDSIKIRGIKGDKKHEDVQTE
jgi:hypothetical protein